jgi:hypothetical protein
VWDILKCGRDEHLKVLGINERYRNLYEGEEAIEQATWKRGMETHPEYNKGKNAQKAFSVCMHLFPFHYLLLTLDLGVIACVASNLRSLLHTCQSRG